MVRFGVQALNEQINPTALLNDVIMTERYGIEKCSPAIIICLGGTLGLHLVRLGFGLGQHLPKQIG
jgi:hypothetical protein